MAAPSTTSHFLESQAVPSFCSCSVCPYWCPYMNLKEFPDGLIEYLLTKNVFEGKHFLEDWRVLPFFSLMVHSYPPQWLLDTLVFLSWSSPDGVLTVSPARAFVFVEKSSTAAQSARLCWHCCEEHSGWMDCMHTNWNSPETTTAPLYQPAADKQGRDSPLTNKRKVKFLKRVQC